MKQVRTRFGFGFIGLVLLVLLLNSQSPTTAKAEPTLKITQLSATSIATGNNLTIRGSLQISSEERRQMFDPGIYTVDLFMSVGNTKIQFGAVSNNDDGSFVWTGPIPRAGYEWLSQNSNSLTIPRGNVGISARGIGGSESNSVTLTITDNTNGPFADFESFNLITNFEWTRDDILVKYGVASRSWLWGPSFTAFLEPYKEAPNGWRAVAYFDKARMELTQGENPTGGNVVVTKGLLVREMVSGQLQLGDNNFQTKEAAKVPAAGDLSANNKTPLFANYAPLQERNQNQKGSLVNEVLDNSGKITKDSVFDKYGAKATNLIAETNHYIASPFWDYINAKGLLTNPLNGTRFQGVVVGLGATGFPITEAYWTKTLVGGVEKDVLVQLFERRALTYTPSNSAAFQVEMGNVGLQYYQWRYGNS